MKKRIISLLVLIMISCDAEDIVALAEDLTEQKKYKVGLSILCDNNSSVIWYCINKTEYSRLLALPTSCDVISITSSNGNEYTGVLNDNRLAHTIGTCKI